MLHRTATAYVKDESKEEEEDARLKEGGRELVKAPGAEEKASRRSR